MRKILFCCLMLFISVAHAGTKSNVLSFDSMYGVDGPFINDSSIRGVLGDELPWDIKSVHGHLTKSGHLFIKVRGLVFSDDPSVPPELRGINDEEKFRAVVSCVTEGKSGIPVVVNVMTHGFPATRHGNSTINTKVHLPEDCLAPIIFIMSGSENKWFSVTGSGD